MVCEPLGSFLIDHFAPRLLSIGANDPVRLAEDGEKNDLSKRQKLKSPDSKAKDKLVV